MKPEDIIKKHLPKINIMQLATSSDNRPYLCTVHYYSDDSMNLYWASTLERHHSKHIERNPDVAAYVLVHENTPAEDYVIGITFIGKAELIGSNVDPIVALSYVEKLGDNPDFVRKVADDTTPFKFYKLNTEKIVLFDNKNFPEDPRKELKI